MSDNAELIQNAKLNIAPVVEFLDKNANEISMIDTRLAELRRELYKLYDGQVEGAVGELQDIAYDYGDGHQEAENILGDFESRVNQLGLGVGVEGGYLWTPSTRSC